MEVSRPGVRVEWRKGGVALQPSAKYEMRQAGCARELCIRGVESEDAGYFTCDAGDQLTTASLAVQGTPETGGDRRRPRRALSPPRGHFFSTDGIVTAGARWIILISS